jgi:predicted MPP superfamily phosphohydrolase
MNRHFRAFLALLLAGLALLAVVLASELLLLPPVLEPMGRAAYRAAFLLMLPARPFAAAVFHYENHHWPISHFVAAGLLTPWLYWAAWRVGRRLWRPLVHRPHLTVSGISRRAFLARSTLGAASVTAFSTGSYASMVEPTRLRVCHYDAPIRDLPREFDGLRIAHVSDTHYGPFMSHRYLQRAMEETNALRPNFVALTGDYVHFRPESVQRGIGVFGYLESRWGAVAVLGNHDHWEGADACRAVFSDLSIPVIGNSRKYLTPEGFTDDPNGAPALCIAGLGDLWEDRVSFEDALGGVDPAMPRLVLSHNPDTAEMPELRQRIDLMLAGHTHGGQVRFPVIGAPAHVSRYGDKYLGGWCEGPACPLVVSRGVGIAGVPMRMGVPPEVGLITLRRAD